jgi:hypothetical protein
MPMGKNKGDIALTENYDEFTLNADSRVGG